jgi:glycosyltransferase involved in cell wall biosynthesis
MHLTADHLRSRHGFDVRHLFVDRFRRTAGGGPIRLLQPWEAGWVVRQAVDELGGCDIVEAHEPLALGCALARRRGRWKLVAFSYGLEERGARAVSAYRRRSRAAPPRLRTRLGGWVQLSQTSLGLRLADHVICSSSEDRDYLIRRGSSPDRISRHFSGVTDELVRSSQLAGEARPPGMLFVGSWIERKGVAELTAAFSRALCAEPQAFATIAGCQASERAVLAAFPAELQGRIRVIPNLESERELADLYAGHRVFVLPSYFEGHPLVMIEAALFGLAIVTTPVCGMLDFIRDRENGLFCAVGDGVALTRSIQSLLRDAGLAHRLGQAARKDALRHTWQLSADNLAAIYLRVVSGVEARR